MLNTDPEFNKFFTTMQKEARKTIVVAAIIAGGVVVSIIATIGTLVYFLAHVW
jgi:hypothetical protein